MFLIYLYWFMCLYLLGAAVTLLVHAKRIIADYKAHVKSWRSFLVLLFIVSLGTILWWAVLYMDWEDSRQQRA